MGGSDSKYNCDTEPEFVDKSFGAGVFSKTEKRECGNQRFGTFDPLYGFPNGRKPRGEQQVQGITVVKFKILATSIIDIKVL